jgi:hypothetical protein
MEKIKNILTYLDSKEVAELKNDLDFSNVIKESKDFFNRTGNDDLLKLLNEEKKDKFLKIISNIDENIKSYVATKGNQYCLLVNHYISDGYDIFFSEIKEFEKKFSETLINVDSKITKLNSDLTDKVKDFNLAISNLENAEHKCKKTTTQVEDLIIEAKNRVNTFADKMTTDNNARIEAKRIQIDNDMTKYREGVEITFNNWVKKFEELEKTRVKFLEMYQIGIKYSGDARFDEYSLKEKRTADLFRWISFGLMIFVVFTVAYLTFKATDNVTKQDHHDYAFSIFIIFSRFLLVFSLMIPAIYTSRESSRHRRNADKYTQMANELKAFDIAIKTKDMKEETKDRIQEEIFKRYFGNNFANTYVDRNISEDIIDIGKTIKTVQKDK